LDPMLWSPLEPITLELSRGKPQRPSAPNFVWNLGVKVWGPHTYEIQQQGVPIWFECWCYIYGRCEVIYGTESKSLTVLMESHSSCDARVLVAC
jgi:hypothetical protein